MTGTAAVAALESAGLLRAQVAEIATRVQQEETTHGAGAEGGASAAAGADSVGTLDKAVVATRYDSTRHRMYG